MRGTRAWRDRGAVVKPHNVEKIRTLRWPEITVTNRVSPEEWAEACFRQSERPKPKGKRGAGLVRTYAGYLCGEHNYAGTGPCLDCSVEVK